MLNFFGDSYHDLSNSYDEGRTCFGVIPVKTHLFWCHSGESFELLRQMALTRETYL